MNDNKILLFFEFCHFGRPRLPAKSLLHNSDAFFIAALMRFIICLIGMSNYFRKISMIEGFHHLRTANVKYRYIHPLLYSVTTARATTLSTSTTLNSKDPNISITDMNLVELKVLLKQLGGSPGTLRKADILALCKKLSQEEQQSLTTENTSAAIAEIGRASCRERVYLEV